jgi:hypothetical protein
VRRERSAWRLHSTSKEAARSAFGGLGPDLLLLLNRQLRFMFGKAHFSAGFESVFLAEEMILFASSGGHYFMPMSGFGFTWGSKTGSNSFHYVMGSTFFSEFIGHFYALVPCFLGSSLAFIPRNLPFILSFVSTKSTVVAILRTVGLVQDNEKSLHCIEFVGGLGVMEDFNPEVVPAVFTDGTVNGLVRMIFYRPAVKKPTLFERLYCLTNIRFTIQQVCESINNHSIILPNAQVVVKEKLRG